MRALLFMGLVLVLFGLIMLISTRIRRWQAKLDREEKADTARKMVRCADCGAFVPEDRTVQTERGPVCPHHQS